MQKTSQQLVVSNRIAGQAMNTIHQQAQVERQAGESVACAVAAGFAAAGLDDEPAAGAHLVTQRRGYQHHGIYVGAGKVVHYAGFAASAHRGPVCEVSLAQFAGGQTVTVHPHPLPKFAGDEAVRRARSRLGENRYRLLTNNCEHFCAWCLFGESRSEQVHACLTKPAAGLHALLCLVIAFAAGAGTHAFAVVRAVA